MPKENPSILQPLYQVQQKACTELGHEFFEKNLDSLIHER